MHAAYQTEARITQFHQKQSFTEFSTSNIRSREGASRVGFCKKLASLQECRLILPEGGSPVYRAVVSPIMAT